MRRGKDAGLFCSVEAEYSVRVLLTAAVFDFDWQSRSWNRR